jgi:hypothetical protein
MADLIDISFIIVAFAIVGYILKDAFFFYRKSTIPYELQSGEERMFSYISLTLFISSVIWWAILTIIKNDPNMLYSLNPIFEGLQRLVEMGVISLDQFNSYISTTLIFLFSFTIFSQIFIFAYTIAMTLGYIGFIIDSKAIKVTYKNNVVIPRKFKRIIHESDEFIYVESLKDFRKWVAIKKEDIERINNIFTDSKFQEFFLKHLSPILNRVPIINNPHYRIILVFTLMVVLSSLSIFSNVISDVFYRILFAAITIPAIILSVIILALEPRKKNDEEE